MRYWRRGGLLSAVGNPTDIPRYVRIVERSVRSDSNVCDGSGVFHEAIDAQRFAADVQFSTHDHPIDIVAVEEFPRKASGKPVLV
jgi:hypothetical protein